MVVVGFLSRISVTLQQVHRGKIHRRGNSVCQQAKKQPNKKSVKAPEQSQRDRRQVSSRTNVSSATQTKRVAVAPLNTLHVATGKQRTVPLFGLFRWLWNSAQDRAALKRDERDAWQPTNSLWQKCPRLLPTGDSPAFSPSGSRVFTLSSMLCRWQERGCYFVKTKNKRRRWNFISLLHFSAVKRMNWPTILEKTSASRLFLLFVFSYKRVCCSEQKNISGFCCVSLKAMKYLNTKRPLL